jgi:hypothetical protein
VDQDVEAAETLHHRLDDLIDSLARTDVCLDEPFGCAAGGEGPGGGDHGCPSADKAIHDGFANALGSTRDQDPPAVEIAYVPCLRFILHEHVLVSSNAIHR